MLSVLPTGVDNTVHPCIAPTCVGADDSVRPSIAPTCVGADDSVRPSIASTCVGADDSVRPSIAPTCVGADDSVRPSKLPQLTDLGRMVESCIHGIPAHLPNVRIDNYVIMPNHIHLLLQITADRGGQSRPPLQKIVQSFKSVTTRSAWNVGLRKLWQRSFYDHIIRNDADYWRIWEYIEHNPLRWSKDIFFEASDRKE
jgi:REP element-mobilizing transposase RayT